VRRLYSEAANPPPIRPRGGGFTYGGGSRGRFWIWRRMSGAVLDMEADVGGGFHYGGGFVLHGGGLSFLI
jgi:hypothetical protein